MERIALKGKKRIAWNRLRGNAYAAVARAVKNGELPNLKNSKVQCADCPARAECYDHPDYERPLEVDAVCRGCNLRRGSNAPLEEVTLVKEQSNKPRCPECNSGNIVYRKTDKMFWCRRCGAEFKLKQKK